AAFQKLKSAKDLAFEFIVCDAKPCGVAVAKKITAKHKDELCKLTGSKRFLHPGTCHFADGRYVFNMEQPITGLARKIQESIKSCPGKKFPIRVGGELAEEDENPAAAGASHSPAEKAQIERLAEAPEAWHKTRQTIEASLNQLKAAVRKDL